jgi:AcrR family transcriptional regulator
MPRPFNEEGKKLFIRFGLKKTGISELTSASGISQGAFYLFFNSKEELYFAILELEEQAIREKFLRWLSEEEVITRTRFKDFLRLAVKVFEENPLLRRLWLEREIDDLLRRLPPELMEQHTFNDTAVLEPLIKNWQDAGYMAKGTPDVIAGVIRALFLLPLHYREIGEDLFPAVLEMYIDFIADGLIRDNQAKAEIKHVGTDRRPKGVVQ